MPSNVAAGRQFVYAWSMVRHPSLRVRSMLVASGFLFLTAACTSLSDGAKEEFSRGETCPVSDVVSMTRPDLHPSDFRAPSKPPADVAADPARLKMWNDKEAESKRTTDAWDDIVELRGCGKTVFYACHRFKSGNTFMCSTLEPPQGSTIKHTL